MEDARLRTFGTLWPHDADDDHGATSEKVRSSHSRVR